MLCLLGLDVRWAVWPQMTFRCVAPNDAFILYYRSKNEEIGYRVKNIQDENHENIRFLQFGDRSELF